MSVIQRFVGVWELKRIEDEELLEGRRGRGPAAGAAYGGYAGRWELDEVCHEVLHHVETAFVPNRVGRTIRRSYSFAEDSSLLSLRPIAISSQEKAPDRTLTWRRRATP